MDVYNFLIGVVFLLVAIIITTIQIREKVYSKKGDFNWGNVQFTSAAIIAYMAGIYLIVTSF
ncbi:MAG: hypothetical protein ACI9QN_001207 [Arcticibacterium sp.]|jgi:hypothetical protein